MKLSKNQYIAITGTIFVPLLLFMFNNTQSATISVSGNGNATAVGAFAHVTQTTNQLATYSWINKNWKEALVAGVGPKNTYTYALNFSANGNAQIVPEHLCLKVLSDIDVASQPDISHNARSRDRQWLINRDGVTYHPNVFPYPSENGYHKVVFCYNNPTLSESFFASFDSIPTYIKAELSTSSDPFFNYRLLTPPSYFPKQFI